MQTTVEDNCGILQMTKDPVNAIRAVLARTLDSLPAHHQLRQGRLPDQLLPGTPARAHTAQGPALTTERPI
jgi:hypothetical protein